MSASPPKSRHRAFMSTCPKTQCLVGRWVGTHTDARRRACGLYAAAVIHILSRVSGPGMGAPGQCHLREKKMPAPTPTHPSTTTTRNVAINQPTTPTFFSPTSPSRSGNILDVGVNWLHLSRTLHLVWR